MAGNRIDFTVGFNIDKTGLNQLENSLDKITAKSQLPGATEQLKEAGVMAQQVGDILRSSFNYDFNQVNIGAFTQGLNSAGLSMDQLRSKFTAAGSQGTAAFSQLGSSILNTKIQIKESNTLLDQMATTMTNTVKWGIASGAFNKVTQSVRESLSYVEKLDKSLNDIRIVTNKSAESMSQFAKDANEAAKGLGASTRDYTEASLIYYQQGLKDNEVKARTETTLKTANVTGQSTSAVSEQLTAVWNGYKVAAKDTEKYVDKLAAVAADSASDLEELSTAMSKVSSSASAMGVDVDSLNAQISTIISTTRQAPESVGTALKTIYARMGDLKSSGTDEFGVSLGEVTSQMKTMGVSILDETGSMRDMGDVIEEVGTKWQSWSREQKQAAAIAMAGKRQYNNLFALFENWDQYNKELKVSQDSLGTLQIQQDTYMESMEAKQQKLRTQTEAFYSALIGDGQEVNNLVDVMTELMTVVTQFTDGMGGGFKSIIGYATILANLFKNQIGKGLLKHFENKRLDDYNQAVVQGKKETYLAGQNLKNINGTPEFSNGKWQATDSNGNVQQLTANQAGTISAFEKEAVIAKEIDSIRKSLTEEEYNSLVTQQQEVGVSEKKLAILKEQQAISKKESNTLFAFQQGDAYQNYQNAKNTPGANVELEGDNFLKIQKERLKAANRLKKEGNKLTEQEIQKLKIQAGYNKDSKATAEVIYNRNKERYDLAKKIVEQDRQEVEWKEQQANTENRLNQNIKNKKEDQAKTQNIQGMIGAASSLAMVLGSVNSIYDTILNKDLSGPEKALQIATQIGMVLPMLISAYSSLNAVTLAGEKLTFKSLAAKAKDILLTKGQTAATTEATSSTIAWNAVLEINPLILLATAIIGVVSAISIFNKSQQQAREETKANNEAAIELADTKKEELETINELAKSYEEVYKTYEKTGKGVDSLKEKSYELIDSFGEQGRYLLGLVDNYSLFNKEVKKLQQQQLEKSLPSLKTGVAAAGQNALIDIQNESDYDKDIELGTVKVNFSELKDIESILEKYYALQEQISIYQERGETDSDAYREAVGMFAKIGDRISEYTDQLEALVSTQSQLIIGAMPDSKDYSSYKENRQEAIQKIKNSKDTDTQQAIKNYIEANEGATKEQAAEEIYRENLSVSGSTINQEYEDRYQKSTSLAKNFKKEIATTFGTEKFADIQGFGETGYSKSQLSNLTFVDNEGVKHSVFNENGKLNPLLDVGLSELDMTEKDWSNRGYSRTEEGFYKNNQTGEIINPAAVGSGYMTLPMQYQSEDFKKIWSDILGGEPGETPSLETSLLENFYAKATENIASLGEKAYGGKNRDKYFEQLSEKLSESGLGMLASDNMDIFSQDFWTQHQDDTVDELAAAMEEMMKNNIRQIQENFAETASQLADNASALASDVLSGNVTTENIASDENYQGILGNAETLKQLYPELIDDVNIITNTQLTGTHEWLVALEEVQDKMDEIKLNELQKDLATSLSEIKVDLNSDEFYDKMDAILDKDYSVIVEIKSQMDDEFETASNTLSKITEQASKIGEKFIVAQKDIKELGETFPGILDNVTYLKDGTIKLNKEATKSAMETAKAEAAATIDSAIADIQANQLKLKQKREYYAAMLTIATKAAEGEKVTEQDKADFEKIIADYQSELNKEVTDTQIKNALAVVSGEADANETDFENYKNLANEKIRVSESMSRTIAQNWKAALAGEPENVSNGAVVSGSYSSKQATTSQEGQKAATEELTESLDSPEQAKQLADQLAQNIKAIDQAIASGNADIVSLMAQKAGGEYGFDNAAKGKGYTPDKSDDDSNDLDKLTDEFDLLENINNQLAIQESYYDRINTLVEHVYGLTKLEGIKEENKILDSQLKLYKQKDKLIQKDINRQGNKLVSYGAKFNEDGTLANHEQVWESLKAKVNKAAAAGKEVTYEKAKQDFEDYEDAYSKYNEALQESGENLAKQQELLYQKVENNVKAIEVEIQVKVDAGDTIRSLQEFRESMASEEDFVTKAKTSITTGMSYDSSGEMDAYLAQAEKAKKAYNKIIKGGTDKTYGTDSEAAMKAYKDYTEKAAESAKSMKEAIDNYWSNMSDWMSSIKEDFDDIQKKIKSITDETKYYSDLLSLIHSSNKTEQAALSTEQGDLYAQSAEYYVNEQKKWNKISEDYQNKIDAQNKAKEKAEEKLKNAKTKKDKKDAQAAIDAAKTNIENYEKLRDEAIENAETAQTNAQQASLNSLKAYQEAFKLSIESAFQDLEDLFTDGLGFDWADKLWSLDKDYITNWYDNIEKEFNIKDFTLMIDMDIDDTSSEAVKQKLADFRDEQEEQLRNQAYLSEYDLKLAKAKYNVLKKEIALQEAQEKKTTLRLRRNSQGNYTYQYTSNSNDIDKAQSELNQAQSDYYKVAKDGYIASYEKSVSLLKSLENDMKQKALSEGLENVDSLTQEEIQTWMQEHVGDYYAKWKVEYDAAYDDYQQVQADYAEAAYNTAAYQAGETDKVWNKLSEDEKKRWIKDSLPKLGTAFTNYYSGINKNSQDMETIVKQVWEKCTKAMSDYKDGFEVLRKEAEVEIPKVNDIIKTNKTEVSKLKEQWDKVDEKYKAYEKEINNSEKIEALQKSLSEVKSPIDDLYTSLDRDVRKVGNLQTTINKLKGKTITVTTNYKNNYDLKINGKSASASEYKAAVSAGQADVSTSGDGKIQAGDIVQGTGKNEGKNKAGIYLYNSKGNKTGYSGRFAPGTDWTILEIVKNKDKPDLAHIDNGATDEYIPVNIIKKYFTGYDTGGYTGEWNSTDGKLALLHEKELVLNKQDTSNMLEIVKSVRTLQDNNSNLSSLIMEQVMSSLYSRVKEIKKEFILQDALTSNYSKEKEANIEQSVVINADFPGVTNAKEIERALNSLENMATQKAYSTRKR